MVGARARVLAVVVYGFYTLAADEDGVVWGFGQSPALGLDDGPNTSSVEMPTPIRTAHCECALSSLREMGVCHGGHGPVAIMHANNTLTHAYALW